MRKLVKLVVCFEANEYLELAEIQRDMRTLSQRFEPPKGAYAKLVGKGGVQIFPYRTKREREQGLKLWFDEQGRPR